MQAYAPKLPAQARGTRGDIDAVIKSGASTMSMIIPTSDLHIECKLRKTRDQVLKATEDCVTYAKAHGLKVDLLAEDSTRSDFDYLVKVFQTAVDCKVDRVTACDTVGILTPDRSFEFYGNLVNRQNQGSRWRALPQRLRHGSSKHHSRTWCRRNTKPTAP